MIPAVCIEDRGGVLLGKRRLSQDLAQREDLLALCRGNRLWLNGYSAPLFAGEQVAVAEDFLQQAGPGDLCFVEEQPLAPVLDRMEGLILYRWNRSYPATEKLDIPLEGFVLKETKEFPGSSHDVITREIYERRT